MVKSKHLYSPQSFVDAVTGHCYIFRQDDTVKEIHDLLKLNEIETEEEPLWDYPLDEIEHIVENNIPVVLVDVSGFNEKDEWIQEYRWFEVPEWFEEGMYDEEDE
jgi:hypothetical protein